MSNNIKLEVGKKYLTRDGRVAAVSKYLEGRTYGFRGNVEGLATYEECWTSDGSWTGGSGHPLDLVSEYVETPAYRFFKCKDSERLCIWRHDPRYDHISDSKFLDKPGDKWMTVPVSLTDNAEDPDMVECDENGVPLSLPPAPEPRIPEGFIEVTRTYPSFTPEARAAVLIRVSDIVLVQANTDGCIVKTASFPQGYSVTESYTTILEKINAALP